MAAPGISRVPYLKSDNIGECRNKQKKQARCERRLFFYKNIWLVGNQSMGYTRRHAASSSCRSFSSGM